MNDLMIHAGAWSATAKDVSALPDPKRLGPKHYPVRHDVFIDATSQALERIDLVPNWTKAQYALSNDGARFFGILPVTGGNLSYHPDWNILLGLRSSTDQSFAAGLVAGDQVMVCDNLCFHGEVRLNRKHTTRILADLPRLIGSMLGRWTKLAANLNLDISWMKNALIGDQDRDAVLVEAVRRKVLPSTLLPRIIQEIDRPTHDEFAEPTIWALRNNITECLKEHSPNYQMQATMVLGVLLRHRFGAPMMEPILEEV